MNTATALNTGIVSYKILINGTDKSASFSIKSMVIHHEVNRIPYASIILVDGDVSTGTFAVSSSEDLIPGSELEIQAGYENDNVSLFTGKVIRHSIKIRESVSMLVVECKHEAVKLTVGPKSTYFYDSSDSDIIESILGNAGINASVEQSNYNHPQLIQYQTTDWDFIVLRAQINGFLCFLEGNTIEFKKPDLSTEAVITLEYGLNIYDFDGEIDARNALKTITSYTWNSNDQELSEREASTSNALELGNLTQMDLAEIVDLENFRLNHGGNLTEEVLQDWADAKLQLHLLSLNRGRIKIQGNASVKPGMNVILKGLGDRFNGKAYITAVHHEIANGNWFTNLQYGLSPQWFSETFEVNAQPASGIIPAISGLQIGKVTQLQDDPEGAERVLVKIPIINNAEEGIWARIALLDAGLDRGSLFRPEIDDEVILGFINDDPNDAVILGALHSSINTAPIEAADENNEKGFLTRSGIQFLFNDEKKSVSITTPGGRSIIINDDDEEIHVDDNGTSSVSLTSDGIALDSSGAITIQAKGDLNLEGQNISIKAQQELKAEGAAGAELSTSAIAVLKGSLVQIN